MADDQIGVRPGSTPMSTLVEAHDSQGKRGEDERHDRSAEAERK